MDTILKSESGLRLVVSLFWMFPDVLKNIPSTEIRLDVLIQNSFHVIQQIVFTNLCKTCHEIIIIPFSTSTLKCKKLEEKKNCKN